MKRNQLFAAFAAVLLFGSAARADWTEEFTGGFSNPWSFAVIPPPSSTDFTIHPNNFLEMRFNSSGAPDQIALGVVPETFTDLAATVSINTGRGALSNNDIFLITRTDGASGYILNLDFATGAVDLVKSTNTVLSSLGPGSTGTVSGFSGQGTYTLQLSAFGDSLFGQVRDQAGTVKSIVSATDSSFASGWTGIGAALNPQGAPNVTPIQAGFDNVGSIEVTSGNSPNNPILPSNGSAPWNFQNAPGDGRWFDPFPASGYLYETDGLSNFTAVILPLGYDLDDQYVVDDGTGPVNLSAGVLHVFSSPASSFSVSGIHLPVDGDNPLAFPTFLSFDQLEVSFSQTPVPEPSTLVLAGIAALVMGFAFRRRRRAA